jgi:hypothetical protein
MSVASAVEQSNESDDAPLVEPLAAPIEGALNAVLILSLIPLLLLVRHTKPKAGVQHVME